MESHGQISFFEDETCAKFHENRTSIASKRANMHKRQLLYHVLKNKSKYALKLDMCLGQNRAVMVTIYLVIKSNGNQFQICSDKHITIVQDDSYKTTTQNAMSMRNC